MIFEKDFNSSIDKETLNWFYKRSFKNIYPPIIAKFNDNYFQLNNFSYSGSGVFLIEFEGLKDLINFQTTLTDDISLVELSNLLSVIDKFDLDYKGVKIFEQKNIKGRKNFEILKKIKELPENFKDYIVEKNITLKQLGVFFNLKDNHKKIVYDFLNKKNKPSVGDFRNLLNLLYDYARLIDIDFYDENYLNKIIREKNIYYFDVMDDLFNLNKIFKAKNIRFDSISNFENCILNVTFGIGSSDDFYEKINFMSKNGDKVKNFYEKLKKYDLC
ncbi:conserved hypothetical protein [Deferribacter desulfuricans SSM1]|uniref:Uncharacterized protein n=2 Tax=Deferribacter TaxID=53572 RepID=D3PDX9_DEFDS|nr:conserved hypothetical protein [Deferribacter desulfuricans SSM1]